VTIPMVAHARAFYFILLAKSYAYYVMNNNIVTAKDEKRRLDREIERVTTCAIYDHTKNLKPFIVVKRASLPRMHNQLYNRRIASDVASRRRVSELIYTSLACLLTLAPASRNIFLPIAQNSTFNFHFEVNSA
jgi:hypothetical protein